MRLTRSIVSAMVLAALMSAAGCSTYYEVTNPDNGRVYYTREFKRKGNGAIVFIDGKTGDNITLASSQLSEVSKKEYNRAIGKSAD